MICSALLIPVLRLDSRGRIACIGRGKTACIGRGRIAWIGRGQTACIGRRRIAWIGRGKIACIGRAWIDNLIVRSVGSVRSLRTGHSFGSWGGCGGPFGATATQLLENVTEGHGRRHTPGKFFPVLHERCWKGPFGCCCRDFYTATQTLLPNLPRKTWSRRPELLLKDDAVRNWCGQSGGYIRCNKGKDNKSCIRWHSG